MSIAIEEHGIYPSVPHHQDQFQSCKPLLGRLHYQSLVIDRSLCFAKVEERACAQPAVRFSCIPHFDCNVVSLDSQRLKSLTVVGNASLMTLFVEWNRGVLP